ncbi:hypothetical protein ABZV34_03490 [Streptomyces sp. NPDC005195]|uniref:hypothetical protein n=1 Tax=Streptomyces sp. NPDC005195 TaxID=3154561 RepID=UPI0033B91764
MTAAGDGDFTEAPETGHGSYDGKRQLRCGMRGLAHAANRAADRLTLSTGEVTRVAHQAGAAGRPGGRTEVRGL